jgi:dihydroxy-acid dehydratase
MYTANTMASAIEALGMSLANSSAQEAVSEHKALDCRRASEAVMNLIRRDIKPLDILTRKAFENAIAVVIALGGSTNAVLHLLAIAREADVELSLDDFTTIGTRIPVLADLRPSGRYLMSELIAIGGIQPLMKRMLDRGMLHGDCLTVSGKTLAENLAGVPDYPAGQDVVRDFDRPIKRDSHLAILYGNLAPRLAAQAVPNLVRRSVAERASQHPLRRHRLKRRLDKVPQRRGCLAGARWANENQPRRAAAFQAVRFRVIRPHRTPQGCRTLRTLALSTASGHNPLHCNGL